LIESLQMAEETVSIDSKDLEKFEIFKGLSQAQVDELYVWLQRRDFHAGDHIFEEGQQTNGLYLLTGGTVSVVKKSTYGKVKLTEIKAPSFFGEMGLLAGGLRTAGVRAVTPVVAGFLPCEVFERKLADSNMTAARRAKREPIGSPLGDHIDDPLGHNNDFFGGLALQRLFYRIKR